MNFLFTNLPVIIDKILLVRKNLLSIYECKYLIKILGKLNDLENKSWSCSDLENSIFLDQMKLEHVVRDFSKWRDERGCCSA